MNPAFSVIFFTTAAGAGYGLVCLLSLLLPDLVAQDRLQVLLGYALGTTLFTAGLLSSTLHLGHPERAWRAFSQWRSSWLSREGVLAVLVYPPLLGLCWLVFTGGSADGLLQALRVACVVLPLATVFATGQIYASLKAIPEWHLPSVTPNYLLLALMSGGLVLAALGFSLPQGLLPTLVVAAALGKGWHWRQMAALGAVGGPGVATGLGHLGTVSVLAQPHTEPNYLQKEMGFRLARKHALKLRRIAAVALFGVPLAGRLAGGTLGALLALPALGLGLLVERWLFFAEARHVVMGYYGA